MTRKGDRRAVPGRRKRPPAGQPARSQAVADDKVEPIEQAILRTLPEPPGEMAFDELVDGVAQQLNPLLFPLRKTVSRYTKAVQLDLERRGLIERVPGVSPIRLRRPQHS